MKHPFEVPLEPTAPAPPEGVSDLRVRAVSAVVLLVFGLGLVWVGELPLTLVTGAVAGLMGWELLRMAAPDDQLSRRVLGGVVTGLVVALGGLNPLFTLISFFAFPVIALIFIAFWPRYRWVSLFGLIYIAAACGAFLLIRNVMPEGRELILAMLGVIWSTDIAAYLGGRFFRGPRLLPVVSPNKTWAGFICGCIAGTVVAIVAAHLIGGNALAWSVLGLLFSAVGQGGDLLESWAKRHFGVKDTSGIIPGHGGLLDRLDGHLASTGVFAVLLLLAPNLAGVLA